MFDAEEIQPTQEWRFCRRSEYEIGAWQRRYWVRLRDGWEGFLWMDAPLSAG